MSISADKVWKPDIVVTNMIEEEHEQMILDQSKNRIILRSDGEITWFIKKTMKTSCPINVAYFPYDTQTCPIKMGSWTLDKTVFQFDVSQWSDSISTGAFYVYSEKSFIPHSAWNVRRTTTTVSEDFDFPEVTISLTCLLYTSDAADEG